MRGAGLVMTLLVAGAGSLAAQGESCRFQLITVGSTGRSVETATGTNFFAGGGVTIGCYGTRIRMTSDSVASYGGSIGIVQFIGNVRYVDTSITMTADNGTYFRNGERWEARGNVVTRNLETGSTLAGPALDYYRVIKGSRDTMEMYATGRPRINYIPRDSTGRTEEPYIINADRVRLKGNDRVWAGGRVTIDRSDFAATADSMRLDTGAGNDGTLIGRPVMRGLGADSFNLRGRRIDLTLADQRLRSVKAQGEGHAVSTDIDLVADTILLTIEDNRLIGTQAWGDSIRPYAFSTDYAIRADSLAFDTPGQHLQESRAFGAAWVGGAVDSAAQGEDCSRNYRICDWLAGDSVVAQFAQKDSAGTARTVLERVLARHQARAHYRTESEEGRAPGVNYSRADRIVVIMKGGAEDGVDRVELRGHVDGVQLDPEAVPTRAPADTTAPPGRPGR